MPLHAAQKRTQHLRKIRNALRAQTVPSEIRRLVSTHEKRRKFDARQLDVFGHSPQIRSIEDPVGHDEQRLVGLGPLPRIRNSRRKVSNDEHSRRIDLSDGDPPKEGSSPVVVPPFPKEKVLRDTQATNGAYGGFMTLSFTQPIDFKEELPESGPF